MKALPATRSSEPAERPSVLFVCTSGTAAARYRCIHPAEQLALYGIGCAFSSVSDPALPEKAGQSKVLVLQRVPADRHIVSLAAKARNEGSVLLFDTDDLLFEPSLLPRVEGLNRGNPFERILRRDLTERLAATLRQADGCIVTTEYLAERVRALGQRAWVVRNAFSLEMLSMSEAARANRPPRRDRLVIGYASGSTTHDRDFEEAAPALREVLSLHREAELWIVGHLQLAPEWDSMSTKIRRIPFVPWQELPALLAGFDVNVAPLESRNPFCEAKSEIKWMEAALVGVPTVASRTEAFEHAIDQGRTGLLAASPDEWLEHLNTLVCGPHLRRDMGAKAREAVLSAYHPAVRGRELIHTLNAIGELVRGRPFWPEPALNANAQSQPPSTCDAEHQELEPTLVRKALYSLRNRGLRCFFLESLAFVAKHMPWRKPS